MSQLAMAARIQIESGIDGDPRGPHRVVINGVDVSLQVRSVDFHIEGGDSADVRVTFANPNLTLEGLAQIVAADSDEGADCG
jgi:hypothetical protein